MYLTGKSVRTLIYLESLDGEKGDRLQLIGGFELKCSIHPQKMIIRCPDSGPTQQIISLPQQEHLLSMPIILIFSDWLNLLDLLLELLKIVSQKSNTKYQLLL